MAAEHLSRISSSYTSERPQAQGPAREASAEDTARFEKELKPQPKEQHDSGSGKSGGQNAEGSGPGMSELSAIFSSLMGRPEQPADVGQPDQKLQAGQDSALSDPAKLQSLADSLVDRILVSDPRHSQGSEVRLTLGAGSGGLEGSEIALKRDLQGLLAIEISCRNPSQFKKYVQLRPLLVEGLEQYERQDVRFILHDPEAAAAEDPQADFLHQPDPIEASGKHTV